MKLLRGIERGNPNKRKRYWFSRKAKNCYWCGTALIYLSKRQKNLLNASGYLPPNAATREHVQPRSHGGTSGDRNLVAACYRCNQERGADTTWVPFDKQRPTRP
jgi:hypothetical protein